MVVNNSKLYFRQFPSETFQEDIVIENPSDKPIELQVLMADWTRDSLGTKQYVPAGTLPQSCADWLQIQPQVALIQAKSSLKVSVSLTAPASIKPEDGEKNTMIFLRQTDPLTAQQTDEQGVKTNIEILYQVGVHVYYIHPSLQQKAISIEKFWYDDNENLILGLKNTGEVDLNTNIALEFTHQETGEEIKLLDQDIQVAFMPNDFRYVSIPVPENLSGRYSVLAIIDLGEDSDLEVGVLEVGF